MSVLLFFIDLQGEGGRRRGRNCNKDIGGVMYYVEGERNVVDRKLKEWRGEREREGGGTEGRREDGGVGGDGEG